MQRCKPIHQQAVPAAAKFSSNCLLLVVVVNDVSSSSRAQGLVPHETEQSPPGEGSSSPLWLTASSSGSSQVQGLIGDTINLRELQCLMEHVAEAGTCH